MSHRSHPSEPVRTTDHLDHPAAADVSDQSAEAVGTLSEAFEYVERAKGHLYSFHQLRGRADLLVGEAVDQLREAGHDDFADELARDLVGRNVLDGRWTFEVVEEFDEFYYELFRDLEQRSRSLTGGVRHLHEARMKARRRTSGHPAHTADPQG
jgi:hypothetical protein